MAASQPVVRLELDCDRTINFAMQQNDVPIIRQIRVMNAGASPLEGIRVRLSSEPELFPAWETTVSAIAPGGTYTLGPVDLRLSANLLMGLTERVSGCIHAEVVRGTESLCRHAEPIEMLAFDEWNGLARSLPELLAAYVLPNHPAVEEILSDAAKWLGSNTGSSSLSGYQTRSPKRVGEIAQAVFKAIQARGIRYCNPPASFESTGQKIRLPDRILESRLATCLDLAVLAAACLEQAGLHPLVVFIQGHAFVGAWTSEDCFPDCATDDLLRVRKRVELNEILVFETTLTTAPPPNDFATAVAAAKRHLGDEQAFQSAIDIHRCRKSRIRPLPTRRTGDAAIDTTALTHLDTNDAVFELGSTASPASKKQPETPATRLDRWKRKLLDLTLHNKLINFKETKSTVPLLCPTLGSLEDSLADGLEFQILPRPEEFAPGTARSAELHRLRTGDDAIDQLLLSEFESRRLRADLPVQDLNSRLTGIYRSARTAMEEGGASALYLALGFLAWYETDSSEQRRLAPIILIPVEVQRHSVQEGYRICQADEEPRINITLLELLVQDFDLRLPSLDPIPEDEHGIDVANILTTFRQAIKDMRRWDVVEEAQIGFFSFTKFLMWRDLEQRSGDLLKNKVVEHLVNHPNELFPNDGGFPAEDTMDEKYQPQDTFCTLPADSSQLAAVYAAAEGKTFVLFGPPGTGKSQTITNLIAHSLAAGKSVLFVSEKMAALNVVHNRLSQCGLGPFCLELHSKKTHKRHVLEQLGEALDFRGSRGPEEWERLARQIAGLRTDLNAYVHALHQSRNFGESVFQATSRLIGLRQARLLDLKLSSPETIRREQLDRWRDLIDQLRIAGDSCGQPASCAWSTCGDPAWSPSLQRGLEADIQRLLGLCDQLESHVQKLGPRLGIGTTWNLSYFEFADKFASFLTQAPRTPTQLLQETDWESTESLINEWLAHGRKRDSLRQSLYQRYEHSVLGLDLEGLAQRLQKARASWFLPRLLGVRAVRKNLAPTLRSKEKTSAPAMAQDLGQTIALRDEEKRLADANEKARQLLGQYWKEGEADWNAIDAVRDWSGRFRKFALAITGSNFEKAAAIRRHWTMLVTEGYESLQPEGDLGQLIAEFLAVYAGFLQLKASIESRLVGGNVLWGADGNSATLTDIRTKGDGWKSNLPGLRAWCNWRQVRREAAEAGLQPLVAAYESGGVPSGELRSTFDRSFYQWWVESVTEKDPVLQQFFSAEHERKIRQFRDIDERFIQLTRSEIQARLAAQWPANGGRVSESSEVGILNRQRQLRRGHMPVRQLFRKIPQLLHRLKPCLLMSPISVSQYLDASHPPFDLVVFDEASQIPVWDSVGAIARGQEAIVVGDPKQLPPTSFFMRADEQEVTDDTVVEEMESILDECLTARLPKMLLRWHYRSQHESLIAFSNYHYYDNSLLTFPSASLNKGVSYRHVPGGIYDKGRSRTNRAEAETVVQEVVRRLKDPQLSRLSIGIVTFSTAQQVLVEDLLDDARREHPEIERFFGEDEAEPVFIKNLENVQGDERDVILFSICYGPDAAGRISMNFGPLNRDGGERRLNVAVTRARAEMIVFATLKAEQIDLSKTRALGAQDLKCFLDYAERGPVAISQALTLRGGAEFDSPFEQDVCQRLRAKGHEVHTQVGCSGYRIDLAVVDPKAPGRYLLGIECDGANYHSAKTARDRDRLRESILVGLGWRIHRVWGSDWWTDPDGCMAKIETAIEQAKLAPVAAPPPPPKDPPVRNELPAEQAQRPEPVNEPSTAAESPVLPQYRAYQPKGQGGSPQEFYLPTTDGMIRKLVEDVIQQEGPVALETVSRRVASYWGLGRVGSTIRERIEGIARRTSAKWVTHGKSVFLWPPDSNPIAYCSFRTPGMHKNEQRDIDEIPPEEIAATATYVLRQQVSLPMADLVRETALVLGFQRTGQTIQRVVRAALQPSLDKGAICQDASGRVRLV